MLFFLLEKVNLTIRFFYGTEALKTLLNKDAPEGFTWQHKVMTETSHALCAYQTLKEGLKEFYKHHRFLSFNSKAEFEGVGGLKYVDDFYEERQAILDIENDDKFKHATRRNLSFLAISEDDYPWFESLFTRFENDSFLEKSFPPHLVSYAEFHLKHNNSEQAKKIMSFAISKYPDNAQIINALGYVHTADGDNEAAKEHFKKAVELGKENGDWRLSEYKENLRRVMDK